MLRKVRKVERAAARKEVGTKHFKAGRWAMAVLRYKSVTATWKGFSRCGGTCGPEWS